MLGKWFQPIPFRKWGADADKYGFFNAYCKYLANNDGEDTTIISTEPSTITTEPSTIPTNKIAESKWECNDDSHLLFQEYCFAIFYPVKTQTMDKIDDNCWNMHRGNLASIHSQEENEAVRKYSDGENFHIGLLKDDGYWGWVDDTPVDWTNWENPDSNNNDDNFDRNDGGDYSEIGGDDDEGMYNALMDGKTGKWRRT